MSFASGLYGARRKSGLSQEAVAEKLGVSRQTISKWETGFHLVKDTTSKPTLTFAQPIQPEGWITRKGGMRPVEG